MVRFITKNKRIIPLENRASVGIRAYTSPFTTRKGNQVVLEIGTHHPKGKYLVTPYPQNQGSFDEPDYPEFDKFEDAKTAIEQRELIKLKLDKLGSNQTQSWEENISQTNKQLPLDRKFWQLPEEERSEIRSGESIEQFLKRIGKI